MTKKALVVWLAINMVTFSSFSIYAENPFEDFDQEQKSYTQKKEATAETVQVAEVFENAMAKAQEEAEAARKAEEERKLEQYIEGLAAYIHMINRNVTEVKAKDMARCFVKYAKEYQVDEKLVMAIAHNESTFYDDAVSCENFKGLMQTGDGLARNAGYSPDQLFDYEVSIKVGARYFSIKMDEFGDASLALTAYNQGSGSVHSGNYTTGYAQKAISRASEIENYVKQNGYI